MNNTISINQNNDQPSDTIDQTVQEEIIIDRIISQIQRASHLANDVVIQDIKSELLTLKKTFVESDFKIRYKKTREKALQQFIDNFPSMLGYWDKDLINVHSNKAYASYFGKEPNDIRGRSISDLLGETIYNLNLRYINGVLAGKTQTFERELPTPSGMVKSTLANYVPHVVNDEVVGFFVIVTDISEKRQLEERAKNLEISLYEQSRLSSLGQMASSIAHEINNPVAIIYSDACLLSRELKKDTPSKDFVFERLSEIQNTALRIEKIVDGLRAIHVGRSEKTLNPYGLNRIVEQVLAICSSRFLSAGLKLNWSPSVEEVWALCDDVQISEIILNILNNAFDEIKKIKNGYVRIHVQSTGSGCEVRISNNGRRIELEERKNLFLPFFTTKGKRGTGLGLKISRDLAHANGGQLTLSDSAETEFILSLQQAP